MRQCILTVGVSGSGKTTWATEFVKGKPWVNLNRDDLRHLVFEKKRPGEKFSWSRWNKAWEKPVTELWESQALAIINDRGIEGIIISDTNLDPGFREKTEKLFASNGFDVSLKVFDVEYEVACARDLNREHSVGASVIAYQIEMFWRQFREQYVPDQSLPKAFMVDLDGTLALSSQRNVFDFSDVISDTPNKYVLEVILALQERFKIVVLSGRDDSCFDQSLKWLSNHGVDVDSLFMRKTGDKRSDSIVKTELFFGNVADRYNVIAVIDDRPKVVRTWRSIGLNTLAVGFQSKEF